MARITLLTDFGTADGYVGAMKGVLSSILPGVTLDDIAHDVAPGDVSSAAMVLSRYWNRFPGGTVHLVVIDPGVGTARRAVAMEVDRRFVVAPDNGVVSRVLDSAREWRAASIENTELLGVPESATFHGRDLFAPAAAHLARGTHLYRMGPRMLDPIRLPEPLPRRDPEGVSGEVIATDRFGNLITNLPGHELTSASGVEVVGKRIPVRRTYGQVAPHEPVALVNSEGRLEVAVRDDSAAKVLGAGIGTPVRVLA